MTEQQAVNPFVVQEERATPQRIDHSRLEEAIAKVQNGLDARAQMIRDDAELDTTEQRLRIRELTDKAEDIAQQAREAYENELEAATNSALESLFYVIPSNRDSVRSAYNDLWDRTEDAWMSGDTEGITYAVEEMERLWDRAVRTGDKNLQTAIGHLAAERGGHPRMAKLRDAWLAPSKEKSEAWQRYNEAGRKLENFRDPHARLKNSYGWFLRKPPEAL